MLLAVPLSESWPQERHILGGLTQFPWHLQSLSVLLRTVCGFYGANDILSLCKFSLDWLTFEHSPWCSRPTYLPYFCEFFQNFSKMETCYDLFFKGRRYCGREVKELVRISSKWQGEEIYPTDVHGVLHVIPPSCCQQFVKEPGDFGLEP